MVFGLWFLGVRGGRILSFLAFNETVGFSSKIEKLAIFRLLLFAKKMVFSLPIRYSPLFLYLRHSIPYDTMYMVSKYRAE